MSMNITITIPMLARPRPSVLCLGEHKPGRIKPGRIKRAAVSLQNKFANLVLGTTPFDTTPFICL